MTFIFVSYFLFLSKNKALLLTTKIIRIRNNLCRNKIISKKLRFIDCYIGLMFKIFKSSCNARFYNDLKCKKK